MRRRPSCGICLQPQIRRSFALDRRNRGKAEGLQPLGFQKRDTNFKFALRAYPRTALEVSSGQGFSNYQTVLGRAVRVSEPAAVPTSGPLARRLGLWFLVPSGRFLRRSGLGDRLEAVDFVPFQ